jgi:MoaA/NifB/PqqE/SkfB family radical SAM enzyme
MKKAGRRPDLNPLHLARDGWQMLRRDLAHDMNYRRVRPTNLLPFLTYRCSSRCRTCSMWQRRSELPELSLAQWEVFFNSLAEMQPSSLRHVEFFGGDVLLRPDVLMPLIARASAIGLDTAVPLNGILLDEAMAARLVASGIRTIYLSIDGVGEVHDRVRGVSGNFALLKRGVAALRAARGDEPSPELVAICTVSRFNADSFEQVLPFAADAGFDRLHFEYAGEFPTEACVRSVVDGHRPGPYFSNSNGSVLVDAKQADRIKRELSLIRSSPVPGKLYVVTANMDVLTTEQMLLGRFDVRRCYVARLMVTIDPFGGVLAWPFFDTYVLGNILERPLSEIWNGPAHRRFLQAQQRGELPICRHCIMSVERNTTFGQRIVKRYLGWRKLARS